MREAFVPGWKTRYSCMYSQADLIVVTNVNEEVGFFFFKALYLNQSYNI